MIALFQLNAHWIAENYDFHYVQWSVIAFHIIMSVAFATYASRQIKSISVTNKGMGWIYIWLIAVWLTTHLGFYFNYDLSIGRNLEDFFTMILFPVIIVSVAFYFIKNRKAIINAGTERRLTRKDDGKKKKSHNGSIYSDWEENDPFVMDYMSPVDRDRFGF